MEHVDVTKYQVVDNRIIEPQPESQVDRVMRGIRDVLPFGLRAVLDDFVLPYEIRIFIKGKMFREIKRWFNGKSTFYPLYIDYIPKEKTVTITVYGEDLYPVAHSIALYFRAQEKLTTEQVTVELEE